MSADLNRVTLVGRLTRDPEARGTGDAICSMRLAVTSRAKDRQTGEWGDASNYFDVTAFGRTAETALNHLEKGRRIGVDGRLSWREWETSDGGKRQSVEVVANDIFFLDSKGGGSDAPQSTPSDLPVAAVGGSKADDSDIPFGPSYI